MRYSLNFHLIVETCLPYGVTPTNLWSGSICHDICKNKFGIHKADAFKQLILAKFATKIHEFMNNSLVCVHQALSLNQAANVNDNRNSFVVQLEYDAALRLRNKNKRL